MNNELNRAWLKFAGNDRNNVVKYSAFSAGFKSGQRIAPLPDDAAACVNWLREWVTDTDECLLCTIEDGQHEDFCPVGKLTPETSTTLDAIRQAREKEQKS